MNDAGSWLWLDLMWASSPFLALFSRTAQRNGAGGGAIASTSLPNTKRVPEVLRD